MENYSPDESAMTSYREAHAKEDQHASDEGTDDDGNWSWKCQSWESRFDLGLKENRLWTL